MADVDRGTNGRTPRLRSLNLESQQDFVRGFREWMVTDMDSQIRTHSEALARQAAASEAGLSLDALRETFGPDPLIASRLRVWITNQRQMWAGLADQFSRHRDHYLDELDRYDALGPGSVELDPDLAIPDYCRHEIHIQPGGYVGNELSGPLYHYGTNSFYMGQNDSDEFHIMLARRLARPSDGEVRSVVDLGCGIGGGHRAGQRLGGRGRRLYSVPRSARRGGAADLRGGVPHPEARRRLRRHRFRHRRRAEQRAPLRHLSLLG
jgi:hypothetical protein